MPTPLLPITARRDPQGELTIGGFSLSALAQEYGTPLYFYDGATMWAAVEEYRTALGREWGQEYEIAYAAKAWLSARMAEWVAAQGLGLDVVSEGELRLALRGGVRAERIHAHGNNKSDAFLRACVLAGVGRVVLDHPREAERLAAICHETGKTQKVWIRLNPATAAATHNKIETGSATSKFGASIGDGTAEAMGAFLLREEVPLQWDGVHFHIGSQFADGAALVEAIRRSAAWATFMRAQYGWTWAQFSPGGGWAVPYREGDPVFPPERAIPLLAETLRVACAEHGLPYPLLVLEPGRELVARAGVALYCVGAVKQAGDVTYAFIDGGMADNPRPALYGARYSALLANREAAPTHPYRIAGPFCESGDVLIESVLLPELREGDLLAVPVSGAYQLSMASNYNVTPRPAVVWIEEDKQTLIEARESLLD